MDLRAEIDRGDVWYEYPYSRAGVRRARAIERRAVLTVYARAEGGEIALARWPTTIGGWQREEPESGGRGLRYGESPVGARVWRDVVASPAWLPPETTPDRELVRRTARGWAPDLALFGPGHRSAYGLVMMPHLRPIERDGSVVHWDQGVRTHGSFSYRSILRGESHGCHRLYNHLAMRLAAFLLAHREHVVHGPVPVRYARRIVDPDGRVHSLRIGSRGVRFELVPPVPVEVLEGRVRGRARRPDRSLRADPDVLRRRAP
jgi:hypothetical protein